MPPSYDIERSLGAPQQRIAGVDEVGRGALAGPVVAAAVVLNARAIPDGLDDSKKLSAKQREKIFAALQPHADIGIGMASCAEIDLHGIVAAVFSAMRRALAALDKKTDAALIDGLHLPDNLPCPAQAIVRGDGRCSSIAAASIAAKITRDRIMHKAARSHPHYHWHTNVGYGTPDHLIALKKHGATKLHRLSFAPISKIINH